MNLPVGASVNAGTSSEQDYCWSYDSFGNRIAQAVSGQAMTGTNATPNCNALSPGNTLSHIASYDANNQLTGMDTIPIFPAGAYDANGNLQMSPNGPNSFLRFGRAECVRR